MKPIPKGDKYDLYSKTFKSAQPEESIKPKKTTAVPQEEKQIPEERSVQQDKKRIPEEKPTQPKNEKISVVIKEMGIIRETPIGREKIMIGEDIEIPLVQIKETVRESKEEISLRNVRKYVNLNFKRELMEAEEKSKQVVVKKGMLSKLFGFKGKKIVLRSGESKQLMLNHLRSTKPYPQEIGTMAVAFYLKEFLQVIFGVEEELTYDKLADVIEAKNIEPEIKRELFEFFRTISRQMYEGRVSYDYKKAYELAERAVGQLLP